MSRLAKKYQSPKGMHDVLPQDQPYWEKIRKTVKDMAEVYGFMRIDTPAVEEADLFIRGVGQDTDIVEKQMYSFKSLGGDSLVLRPEGTAGVARSYLEHGMINLPHPVKLYYIGPFFRYEQPQSGRFRQFNQFGFEIIGEKNPVLDAQIIQTFLIIAGQLGLKNLTVKLNSIGCRECRPEYRKALKSWLGAKSQKLCADCRKRSKSNPLRALDCKDEKCRQVLNGVPNVVDYLCQECHNHFKRLLEFLDELGIAYLLDSYLVRGLDYYSKTVFEVFEEGDDNNQIALGGGGRYDNLIKDLGGKDTPAVGAAFGVERIVELMRRKEIKFQQKVQPKIFLIQLGDLGRVKSLRLFSELYRAGILAGEAFSKDSIKSQLKIADRLGVGYSVIIGQQEALHNSAILRNMQSGVQETIHLDKIVQEIKKRIKKVK